MAILVTGAGIIGSWTARLLAERGERVCLLDAAPNAEAVASVAAAPGIELVKGDVRDAAALAQLVRSRGVTGIVHTAAMLARAILADPAQGVAVNILGTTNLLEAARAERVRRVVLASSATVGYPAFGAFRGTAFPEDFAMRVVSERPNSLYTVTKLAGEHLGLYYRDRLGVDVLSLRYGAVLGAWRGPNRSVPGRAVLVLLEAARERRAARIDDPMLVWQGGEEFVDARDVALANVAALEAASPRLGVYNVSSGVPHTHAEVVATVRRLHPGLRVEMEVEAKGGIGGFPHLRPAPTDLSAAKEELGFAPRHSLEDSVRLVDSFL